MKPVFKIILAFLSLVIIGNLLWFKKQQLPIVSLKETTFIGYPIKVDEGPTETIILREFVKKSHSRKIYNKQKTNQLFSAQKIMPPRKTNKRVFSEEKQPINRTRRNNFPMERNQREYTFSGVNSTTVVKKLHWMK